jgi:hypothetical protein
VCRQQVPGVLVLQGVFQVCDDGVRVLKDCVEVWQHKNGDESNT